MKYVFTPRLNLFDILWLTSIPLLYLAFEPTMGITFTLIFLAVLYVNMLVVSVAMERFYRKENEKDCY
jgi:Na+-transporting methylmalonyl-CoA/oxaloacetate decarboxylase gamma subunit